MLSVCLDLLDLLYFFVTVRIFFFSLRIISIPEREGEQERMSGQGEREKGRGETHLMRSGISPRNKARRRGRPRQVGTK